jgi:hypothetical protein
MTLLTLNKIKDSIFILENSQYDTKLNHNFPDTISYNTKLPLACLSKSVLSYLFNQIPSIDLDIPLCVLFSSLSIWSLENKTLTYRDLLNHRWTIEFSSSNRLVMPDSLYTKDNILQAVSFLKPYYPIGSRYTYSNYGYRLACLFLEMQLNESLDTLLKMYVFDPLGLSETTIYTGWNSTTEDFKCSLGVPFDYGYNLSGVQIQSTNGCMNLMTTLHDMNKWISFWYEHYTTLSSQVTIDSNKSYSFGWVLKTFPDKSVRLSHEGDTLCSVCKIMIYPHIRRSFLLLTNTRNDSLIQAIGTYLENKIINQSDVEFSCNIRNLSCFSLDESDIETEKNEEYTGNYTNDILGSLAIQKDIDKLRINFAKSPLLDGILVKDKRTEKIYSRTVSSQTFDPWFEVVLTEDKKTVIFKKPKEFGSSIRWKRV